MYSFSCEIFLFEKEMHSSSVAPPIDNEKF